MCVITIVHPLWIKEKKKDNIKGMKDSLAKESTNIFTRSNFSIFSQQLLEYEYWNIQMKST